MGDYNRFESTAARWLTETVNVYAARTTIGMGGAVLADGDPVITGLACSIQPRAAFAVHTVLGWLPEQSHTLYCKAIDEDKKPLDIKLGYIIEEVNGSRRWTVIAPPELYIDPETRLGHHYEVALKLALAAR